MRRGQLVAKNLTPIQANSASLRQEGRGVDLYLVFQRAEPGAHLITLDDTEVEVVVKTNAVQLKRKFTLKNMVYQGKLEL